MNDDEFHVYDTTLRDGAQREGLSLSVADKLPIARHLDDLGVGFIEGGWPGANPKDTEFFQRAQTELKLSTAQLTAFGATRRPGAKAADDALVGALRDSGAPVVCLVAKSHVDHVERALRTPSRRTSRCCATRSRTCAPRGSGSSSTPSTSSMATPPTRRTPSRWCARRRRPVRTWSSCATPTAACCRRTWRTSYTKCWADLERGSGSTATTTRRARSRTPSRLSTPA